MVKKKTSWHFQAVERDTKVLVFDNVHTFTQLKRPEGLAYNNNNKAINICFLPRF